MNSAHAHQFASEWIDAWNAHDLDRVLSHYTDDFEMSSPFIGTMMNEPTSTLRGKQQVGEYWRTALDRNPDLRFELIDVFTGANSVVVHYKSIQGRLACEVFFFSADGKVYRAAAHYDRT